MKRSCSEPFQEYMGGEIVEEKFRQILDKVPCYNKFFTVEEMDLSTIRLAEQYPDVVQVFEAGRSENNHPIYCLKIGNGSRNALLYGCPHPNEPVGAMMLEHLSECMAEDKKFREIFDYTWYIVKCSDPDATMLNEGWFAGPFTITNYARNFYRPPAIKQVDWSFPIRYKKLDFNCPISETRALMNVIDQAKPTFVYPLHNSGFGGAYWYMSHSLPELHDRLNNIPRSAGIPLSLGEPEAPYSEVFGPAIYKTLSMRDEYDYLETYGGVDPAEVIQCGTCGLDYAIEVSDDKVFGFVTEVPYFYDKRIDDTSESQREKKEVILESCDFQEKFYEKIIQTINRMEGLLSEDNPFMVALADTSKGAMFGITARKKLLEERVSTGEMAKVSEVFDNLYVSKFYCLLSLGLLLRLLEHETNADRGGVNKKPETVAMLNEIHEQADKEFSELSDYLEKEIEYSVIPIQKLVRIQMECGLLIAKYLEQDIHNTKQVI